LLVYDRDRSASTQQLGRDATFTVTAATGDLAPFAAIDWEGSNLNAAGTVLSVIEAGGTGNFIQLRFGQAVYLDAPLPLAAFYSGNSSVYLDSVAILPEDEPGASFALPEPASGAALAAGVLGALAAHRGARRPPG
jgi:MYXO-CTERM domain-containing protein